MSLHKHQVYHVTGKRRDLGRDFGLRLCSLLEANSIFGELQCSAVVVTDTLGLQIRVERPVEDGIDYVVTHRSYDDLETPGVDLTLKAMFVVGGLMASLLLKELA